MSAHPAQADQVTLQRLALMGIQRFSSRDMRTRFNQWDAELNAPTEIASPPEPSAMRADPWAWATGILLLLLALGAFWHFNQIKKARDTQDRKNRKIAFCDSMIAILQADYWKKTQASETLLTAPGTASDSIFQLEIKRLREELECKDRTLRELEHRQSSGNA